jgi:16S rRNA (adenine1518-N6/adenine1519-N6)-dimethyltransferase
VAYLNQKFPDIGERIISRDILDMEMDQVFSKPFAVIGNFPYNISSQLFFKILNSRHLVIETICMIQKEVAARIASPPGSREYGILSVLLQAYFDIEYLFTVPPQVFIPPPKVQSAVIRLRRNDRMQLECSDDFFKRVVKTAFNQRRKTLRNSLKNILLNLETTDPVFQRRPEQLGVDDFVRLALLIGNQKNGIT